MGYLHLYCGEGKGKTTAAAGLALRMAGAGKRAVFVRFLKNDDSGEVRALGLLPGVEVLPCKKCFGFTWQMTPQQKSEARLLYGALLRDGFAEANRLIREGELFVLLVLDEACAALEAGLLDPEELLRLLDQRPPELEVAVTGRRPPDSFWERADYLTEMKNIRHPFDRGIGAREGIEY